MLSLPVRKVCQLYTLLFDIEEVAVGVEVVQPVRIDGAQLLEVGHRLVHLPHVVKCYRHLGMKIGVLIPGQQKRAISRKEPVP